MSAFTVAPYEASDRQRILELMREVGRSHLDEAEFEWWFERNPASPRLVSVARAEGGVVGTAGISLFRVVADGREHMLAVPVHAATASGHRRLGVFSSLEARNEQDAAAAGASTAVAFPHEGSNRILRSLGWHELTPLRIWARPLDVGSVLRRLARRSEAAGGLRPRTSDARTYGALRVETVSRFDSRAESAWRRAVRGKQLVRDAEHLNWRYVDTPREYRCFAACRGSALVGFAVVGHVVKHGVSVGFVADLVATGNAVRVALLRRCADELAPGTAALVSLVAPEDRRAFMRAGFIPTHERIRVVEKALGDAHLVDGGAGWRFTLGDLDFF